MIRELRIRLIEAASHRDEFVHYDEVAAILGVSHGRLDHSHDMNQALEEISGYEHDKGRPMLTAVVVHKGDSMPGKGFFALARRLGKLEPGQNRDDFYLGELARLRKYWAGQTPTQREQVDLGAANKADRSDIAAPGAVLRIVLQTSMETNCESGRHVTEKFRVPDNSRLCCRVRKRRTRLLPLNIFRSAYFEAALRDAATDKVARDAMKEGRGTLFVRGRSTFIFFGRTAEREMVIQNGGEYYLDVRWKSLIESWDVKVDAPKA